MSSLELCILGAEKPQNNPSKQQIYKFDLKNFLILDCFSPQISVNLAPEFEFSYTPYK